jgi:hypothetical protein
MSDEIEIKLSNDDLKSLISARNSLMTNRNESITEHSANQKLFVDIALKHEVTNQQLWDYIQLKYKK